MKAQLVELVRGQPAPQARNLAREYLQARILASLQRQGAMLPLAFHGGTALRFLYAIDRFSEDLDFALERDSESYDFRRYLEAVRKDLEAQGYAVALKASDRKTVHNGFIRFPGLPFELGLSPHADEVLAVKLEVDTRPPHGAGLTTTIVRRFIPLNLQHHDRSSLLAGKLHAVLQRNYLKGRDLYDLAWYLSDPAWPPPNLVLLNNALVQTGWAGGVLTPENWKSVVRTRLEDVDWAVVRRDVRPFLESSTGEDLLSGPALSSLLKN